MSEQHQTVTADQLTERSLLELVRDIVSDSSELVRKEMELGRQEIVEGISARVKGMAVVAAGGLLGLFVLGFLGLAAAAAPDGVMAPWASRLVVAAAFAALAGVALVVGRSRAGSVPLSPEETKRTVKEEVEWVKTQLRR